MSIPHLYSKIINLILISLTNQKRVKFGWNEIKLVNYFAIQAVNYQSCIGRINFVHRISCHRQGQKSKDNHHLKCYYDEKIVYPTLILSKSIFKMKQNGTLGFLIPHLVPEIFRFLKYASEKRMTSFYTRRLNKIHKMRNISANNG